MLTVVLIGVKKCFQFVASITRWFNFCTLVNHFSKLFDQKNIYFQKKKKHHFLKLFDQKNIYFRPKTRLFSKKKKVFTWNRSPKFLFSSQNHSALQKRKVAAACHRQDLCKIVPRAACGPRARSWTTLFYHMHW